MLLELSKKYSAFEKQIMEAHANLQTYGIPQIDYRIHNESLEEDLDFIYKLDYAKKTLWFAGHDEEIDVKVKSILKEYQHEPLVAKYVKNPDLLSKPSKHLFQKPKQSLEQIKRNRKKNLRIWIQKALRRLWVLRDYAAHNGIPFDRRNLEITQCKSEEHEDDIHHTEQMKEMEAISEFLDIHSFFNDKDFQHIKTTIIEIIKVIKKQNQLSSV